jgi:hypothetical protein
MLPPQKQKQQERQLDNAALLLPSLHLGCLMC